MANYTKPYDKNYEDTPEDYLYLAMVFSQVLDTLLAEGQGVVIELKGDTLKLRPEKSVVVFNDKNMIRIIENTDENLKHGDRVIMINGDNIQN